MNILTLVVSGIMVNFIFFSIFLSVLLFLQLAYITFISRKNINVIVLREKEIILSTKFPATLQQLQGQTWHWG